MNEQPHDDSAGWKSAVAKLETRLSLEEWKQHQDDPGSDPEKDLDPVSSRHFFSTNGWREDPLYTHKTWQREVSEDKTRYGYIDWVIRQYEAEDPMAAAYQ